LQATNITLRAMAAPPAKRQRMADGEDHFVEHFTNKAIDNVRISEIKALAHPQLVVEEYPRTDKIAELVGSTRQEVSACILGTDDRVVVIVGPCSVHDPKGAMEYAQRLKSEADRLKKDILVVMRVYFEKPRTTVGWKGLINDPYLDESYRVNDGLRIGRRLLRDVNALGLPVACELLDTLTPPYISDLVSWGAIGARTTECQTHREMASGLSMPVGFKNGTSGDVGMSIDAVVAAKHPHCFFSITHHGTAAIIHSKGNDTTHVVLRGGKSGPNYEKEHVDSLLEKQSKAGLNCGVIVDCSHGNSMKNHKNQPKVLENICGQIKSGTRICGVMIESNLFEGRQDLPTPEAIEKAGISGAAPSEDALLRPHSGESQIISAGLLRHGVSITDACVDWTTTVEMLEMLAKTVRDKRGAK